MRTEESEQEIDEFKFLNVKEVQVVGTQLHVYPAYGERDLMIENDVEVYVIEMSELLSQQRIIKNVKKLNIGDVRMQLSVLKLTIPIDNFQINPHSGISTIKLERFFNGVDSQIYLLMINDKLHKIKITQEEIEEAKKAQTKVIVESPGDRSGSFISRVGVGLWNYFSGTPKNTPEKITKVKVDKKDIEEDPNFSKLDVIRVNITSERNQRAIYSEKDKVFTDFHVVRFFKRAAKHQEFEIAGE